MYFKTVYANCYIMHAYYCRTLMIIFLSTLISNFYLPYKCSGSKASQYPETMDRANSELVLGAHGADLTVLCTEGKQN